MSFATMRVLEIRAFVLVSSVDLVDHDVADELTATRVLEEDVGARHESAHYRHLLFT
jgi:hypothetical protein